MTDSADTQTSPRFTRTRASLYVVFAIALLIFEFGQVWSGVQNIRRWHNLDRAGIHTTAEITDWNWDEKAARYEVWIAFETPDGDRYDGRLFLNQVEATTWEIKSAQILPLIIHPDVPWLVYRLPDEANPPLLWQAFLVTNPESTEWSTIAVFIVVLNGVIVFWLWRARRLWHLRAAG